MISEQMQPTEPTDDRRKPVLGLATIFLTYLVYSYFFQILLVTQPKIAASLNGMQFFSWGVSIPNLGLAFSMLVVGKLSDLYGRRALLLVSLLVCLAGTIWSANCSTFPMLIVARTFLSIGQGGLAPLCFSALGDMFEPAQRSKWVGLLNIPAGIVAIVAPTLGGWFVDDLSWTHIFWWGVPMLVVCLLMVVFGLSGKTVSVTPKIDSTGAILAAVASSAMILAFSMAGTMYPWSSVQVIGLLVLSIVFWMLFVKAERCAEEPILDLQLLRNRSFVTLLVSSLFSCFGMAGLMTYYPLLIQGVQGVSATQNGQIMTPGNVIMNFLGVAAGFILARTRRYRWMFLFGYGLTLAIMIALIFFNASTPLYLGFIAFTLAGLGMGSIPTLNTLVAQYAVPQRLLGVAMGALYFSVLLGQAIAPAILWSAMSMKYNSSLQASLPAEVTKLADKATMTSLGDFNVLLSGSAMASLKASIDKAGPNAPAILDKTVSSIRSSMEAGLRTVFIIGALAMLLTFCIICTLPQISIRASAGASKED